MVAERGRLEKQRNPAKKIHKFGGSKYRIP